jgi:hypothetical protein
VQRECDRRAHRTVRGADCTGRRVSARRTDRAADRLRAGALRLWGGGSWARSGSRRTLLKRFPDGSRIDLHIDRVSSGSATCTSRVGTRLVWVDARGRERASRPIFYRQLDCRRAKLDGGPLRDDCRAHPGRVLHVFEGRVLAGRPFTSNVGRFVFELRPENGGWTAGVRQPGRPQDLTSLIPLHGPRATDIVADTVDNRAAVKVGRRPFSFSPEVGRTIVVHDAAESMLADDVRIEAYGRGVIEIRDYALAAPSQGQAGFAWLEFLACLSWPAGRP